MIKFVDMFSGIGGFREGLTRAGGFECVGHCEIDKYANRSYNALFDTKGEWFIEDARKADPGTMPDFQLLCGGFPDGSNLLADRIALIGYLDEYHRKAPYVIYSFHH